MRLVRAALIAVLVSPFGVLAQTPAPAGAAPASAPKPSCSKPDEFPGRLASDYRKKAWNKDVTAYIDCMKKFIDEQKTQGDLHYNAAQAAIATINKEIEEFNAATKE